MWSAVSMGPLVGGGDRGDRVGLDLGRGAVAGLGGGAELKR